MLTAKRVLSLGLFLCLLSAGIPLIQAQVLDLSFDDAWELASSDNPQVKLAQLNLEKADGQIGEAYASAMPVITANGYYQRSFIIPEMIVEMPPEFGGGTSKLQFEQDNLFNGSIELSQPLYAAGKVGLALKIAKLYRQVTEEQLTQTKTELKLLITQLYFGAVVAADWELVARETYDQMAAHLEKVEDMYREGIVSEYDLIRSQVQVSNFYPQVINAQTTHKVAFEVLAIALNIPSDQQLNLTDDLTEFQSRSSEMDNTLGIALASRSELKQIDLQRQMLDKLLTIERHGIWWPNISLVGGYSRSAQEPDFKIDDYYWTESLYGGISVSIPLFDGFKAKHRAQQVRVDLKTLDLQRDQVMRGINLEIIEAEDRREQALSNVTAQTEGVSLAEKGKKIAEVRYENGLATQLEVLDAQIALNQAKTNELAARYEAITAAAALDKALGRY
ncbi:MAG: TolC family protein [bacterium]